MTKRSVDTILRLMLQAASERASSRTRLQRLSECNWKHAMRLIDILMAKGLLDSQANSLYSITPAGKEFLAAAETIHAFLGDEVP